MENWIDVKTFDIEKFARSLEKDCQEGVKWERRKLEWILEEKKAQAEGKSEAA
ncbi:hypothetical protein [Granulicella tundricola]|uniref:Uncharacterized protein n=1 Tax=Granulicella tundricola (strain ATCC BAA-1859 / DSM 23138 / MP5ACTX9) TaxID=1198114 RepID=E8WWG7_GRATM|nr:hypothetical protein [Granulicella tundricola]ADW69631.1 hypothetical protein AciX9_2606 [Granulicella tundricola MP5ACTX9]